MEQMETTCLLKWGTGKDTASFCDVLKHPELIPGEASHKLKLRNILQELACALQKCPSHAMQKLITWAG